MSAVIHAQIPGSGQLPLTSGDPQRVLVFGAAGPVTLAGFLAQVQHLAGSLPEALHVVHLAEDRVTIKTAENTRLVIARPKIARVLSAHADEGK